MIWSRLGRWCTLNRLLSIVLIALVLGAVGALGYVAANQGAGERLTEFYYLGLDGNPLPEGNLLVQSGGEGKIKLFIVNREGQEINYTVKVKIGENSVDVEVDGVTMRQIPVTLAHGGQWEEKVTFKPPDGLNQVEFLLYKGGATEPYASPYLWVDVS